MELTVHHLHSLRRQNQLGAQAKNSYAEKFKAGFRQCAAEVGTFLESVDQDISYRILKHLNGCINHIDTGRSSTNNDNYTQENRSYGQTQNVLPIIPTIATVQQQIQQHKTLVAMQMDQSKRNYQYRTTVQSNTIMTHLHTPPLSPKIDVDDSSVWRPW